MKNKDTFNVYIDESGDEGFSIKNGEWVSTQWFVMGAFVVRETNDLVVSRNVNKIKSALGIKQSKPLHFKDLTHERKKFAIKTLTETGLFRCTFVAVNKQALGNDTPLKQRPFLYNYCTRYLLERVSWLVADYKGKANLIFENRSETSYEHLEKYIKDMVNHPDSQIRKNVIHGFKPVNKIQSKNLQLADVITGSLFKALEITNLGLYESAYIESLKPFIYSKSANYHSYGLKLFPVPFNDPSLIKVYRWAENFVKEKMFTSTQYMV